MTEEKYMRRALELAARAKGRTSPNPMVGCVIVWDGAIVGEGFHAKAGEPHAEILALRAAGPLAAGADVYVTLEPCAHSGRTPPCCDALIAAGVRRVVGAMTDPNPLVSGRGYRRLRAAGVAAETGLLAAEAARLNEAFIKVMTKGLPFVLYKCAMTLDGKIAAASGDARWVSGPRARQYAHELRTHHDVIMVGSGTLRRDDPALTCRLPGGRDPVRLIVDGKLTVPDQARALFPRSPASLCLLAAGERAPAARRAALAARPGVEVWQYAAGEHPPLPELMRDVARRGWNSVLLEGGGELAGHMLAAGLIDKIEFIVAPKFIGGAGPSPLRGLQLERMADAVPLRSLTAEFIGPDLKISAYVGAAGADDPPAPA
ncbi:MAG: bifunctional diaminohydroxyphosphoribosylaminopyrimidine deaminase/5-amino-6-(5-phosphoribosylamino)uracil reductase RibD [Gracilibacteraceae bacterium]|jgi:diaminohydroxyphosphoribosylaminopyrimidine deaminase/5-amino-6-(5-phosphoribosylamino)uracil reductase|nr:bifunctional diaminohydroxyphosphoribosylaminopyrimidine deaminase/5-amino-6-(5-phosphoribosylamino)uracil reductase RibD [Gracilibacteraceae bacterium]